MDIFGVINASPDSLATFSIATTPAAALKRAHALIEAGATFIDLGAEGSTGHADAVTPDAEWARLAEPLRALADAGFAVSVDTRHAVVAQRALDAGAVVLNAGDALQSPQMLDVASASSATVVLPFMAGPHFRALRLPDGANDDATDLAISEGEPAAATDPIAAMCDWFTSRLHKLASRGLADRLLADPGVGFGPPNWEWEARRAYQRAIYAGLDRLRAVGLPLYVPLPWLQTPDRLALMDIALAHQPEYVRCHVPSQVLARAAAIADGAPLPTDLLVDDHC